MLQTGSYVGSEISCSRARNFRFGGMMGSILTCPLDVVKTRLQSDFYSSQMQKGHLQNALRDSRKIGHLRSIGLHFYETFQIMVYAVSVCLIRFRLLTFFSDVYKLEGGRALFKGLGPNLVGVIPAR